MERENGKETAHYWIINMNRWRDPDQTKPNQILNRQQTKMIKSFQTKNPLLTHPYESVCDQTMPPGFNMYL